MDIDNKLDLIRKWEPTDREVERLADFEKPDWGKRDFNASAMANVALAADDDRGAAMAGPRCYEGNAHFRWKDTVLFTVGAGVTGPDEAREALRRAKIMAIDGLKTERKRERQLEEYHRGR